jgi:hypothetical protein
MLYRIKTIENWRKNFEPKLAVHGWKLWQMQFRWNLPEGYHAWFWHENQEDIELVTWNEEVEEAIREYNPSKKAPGG